MISLILMWFAGLGFPISATILAFMVWRTPTTAYPLLRRVALSVFVASATMNLLYIGAFLFLFTQYAG